MNKMVIIRETGWCRVRKKKVTVSGYAANLPLGEIYPHNKNFKTIGDLPAELTELKANQGILYRLWNKIAALPQKPPQNVVVLPEENISIPPDIAQRPLRDFGAKSNKTIADLSYDLRSLANETWFPEFQAKLKESVRKSMFEQKQRGFIKLAETVRDKKVNLSERETVILVRRIDGRTYQEIGRELGITRERVRQLWMRLTRKLLNPYREYLNEIKKQAAYGPVNLQAVCQGAEKVSKEIECFFKVHNLYIDWTRGVVYSGKPPKEPRKDKNLIEALKTVRPQGFYLKESDKIEKELKSLDPEITSVNLKTLARKKMIILWGRGFYTYPENIQIKPEEIQPVISFIREKLRVYPEGFSVYRAYQECQLPNIPNELALYSVLRLYAGKEFYFPKAPWVQAVPGKARPYRILDNFVRERKRVTWMELADEFIRDRGWKDYMLYQGLLRNERIIKAGDQVYAHLDSLPFDKRVLEDCAAWAEQEKGLVSVLAYFASHQEKCQKGNIDQPILLYNLMRQEYSSKFYFMGYPLFTI